MRKRGTTLDEIITYYHNTAKNNTIKPEDWEEFELELLHNLIKSKQIKVSEILKTFAASSRSGSAQITSQPRLRNIYETLKEMTNTSKI